jgi:hypothetical protein
VSSLASDIHTIAVFKLLFLQNSFKEKARVAWIWNRDIFSACNSNILYQLKNEEFKTTGRVYRYLGCDISFNISVTLNVPSV